MEDRYGRKIDYLRLSVTDLCNYRCRYCMPEAGVAKLPRSGILSVEEIGELGRAAVNCGVTKIRLTGGEPLVRGGIIEICRALSSVTGLRELCMTTNGSLLERFAVPLRDAGVSRLNISLDTLVPEKFASVTRQGDLDGVLRGIRAAEAAGFRELKLNTVLIGGFNDSEIENFVALTREHPWEVRFIELMPMGECARWDAGCFLSGDEVLRRCPELESVGTRGVARQYRLPGAPGTVGLISPMSHSFCSRCRRIRVTAEGRLMGCLHSREEIPLRGLHGPELEAAIRRGIAQKPERHRLTEGGSETPREMNEIGG
ncbi:MAG: GTP 3',8-cyclase MoaA [Oscillibacter sp.]|nr:GTP 3',8-cyclase MoaA [Oscillibacter sp.]